MNKEIMNHIIWIWEAKYTIKTHKQLEEDFGQTKSYALRLKSSGLGLVSQEGVWLSTPEYDLKKFNFGHGNK